MMNKKFRYRILRDPFLFEKKKTSFYCSFVYFLSKLKSREEKTIFRRGDLSKCILKKLRVTKKKLRVRKAAGHSHNTTPHICEDLITSFLIIVHSWSTFRSSHSSSLYSSLQVARISWKGPFHRDSLLWNTLCITHKYTHDRDK